MTTHNPDSLKMGVFSFVTSMERSKGKEFEMSTERVYTVSGL